MTLFVVSMVYNVISSADVKHDKRYHDQLISHEFNENVSIIIIILNDKVMELFFKSLKQHEFVDVLEMNLLI